MEVANDKVVSIHYTLRDDAQSELDSSKGSDPLLYLHGHSQIVPGLEKALIGKKTGDKVLASIQPSDGYGDYDPELTSSVARKQFPKGASLNVGEMFEFSNSQGEPIVVRIAGIDGENVTVDANHPLAGKVLHFDVEIVDVRAATKEELEHGHAHPGDGHYHH